MSTENIWESLREEAAGIADKEEVLRKVLDEFVLDRNSLADALGWRLAVRLGRSSVPEKDLRELIRDAYLEADASLLKVCADVQAVRARDPAHPQVW